MRIPSEIELSIDAFLTAKEAKGCSRHTLRQYRNELKRLRAYLANQNVTEVEQIQPGHLVKFLVKLRNKNLKPNSQHAAYRAFRAWLRWHEKAEQPAGWRNPVSQIEAPIVPKKRLPAPPQEDLRAILATCNGNGFYNDRDRAIILFLLDSGVRATECCMIDMEHVDLRHGIIRICHAKGHQERSAYLDPNVIAAIKRYLKHRGKDQLRPNAPLWVNDQNERFEYWALRRMVVRRAEKAGVPMPKIHGFRRACATMRNEQGVTPIDLQRILGHSNLDTLWRYVDINQGHMEEVQRRSSPISKLLR